MTNQEAQKLLNQYEDEIVHEEPPTAYAILVAIVLIVCAVGTITIGRCIWRWVHG